MSKETQRSLDRLDWDSLAADALELARLIPPGPERNEALKLASLLRCTADTRGLILPNAAGRGTKHRRCQIPKRQFQRGARRSLLP
jgi:hypothetical protein